MIPFESGSQDSFAKVAVNACHWSCRLNCTKYLWVLYLIIFVNAARLMSVMQRFSAADVKKDHNKVLQPIHYLIFKVVVTEESNHPLATSRKLALTRFVFQNREHEVCKTRIRCGHVAAWRESEPGEKSV
jgi:hypothetical protein